MLVFQTDGGTPPTPPESPRQRLTAALDFAWEITKAKFRDGQIRVATEAPLQHQYARALDQIGDLLTTHRHETWLVDLEVRERDLVLQGHDRYLDVVCELDSPASEDPVTAAVELKFKPGNRGAPQGSVQALADLRSLEIACEGDYDMGRLLMATENEYYWREPLRSEIRETFGIYQGRRIEPGNELVASTATADDVLDAKTEDNRLRMTGSYEFNWDDIGAGFRFLSVPVAHS